MERYELTEAQKNELSGKSFDDIAAADSEFISKSLLDPNATQHYNPEVIRLLIQKAVRKNGVVNADVNAHYASLEALGKAIKSMETKADYIAGINNLRNLGSPQNPINGIKTPSASEITDSIQTPNSSDTINGIQTPSTSVIIDESGLIGGDLEEVDGVKFGSENSGQTVQISKSEIKNESEQVNSGEADETNDSAAVLVIILIVIFILILPILLIVFVLKGIGKTLSTDVKSATIEDDVTTRDI